MGAHAGTPLSTVQGLVCTRVAAVAFGTGVFVYQSLGSEIEEALGGGGILRKWDQMGGS